MSERYIRYLEHGQRVPSREVAGRLIDVLALTGDLADRLWAVALPASGLNSPYREGWRPGDPEPT